MPSQKAELNERVEAKRVQLESSIHELKPMGRKHRVRKPSHSSSNSKISSKASVVATTSSPTTPPPN